MELRHLRYFVAAAEAENVSRAALKLHVSQPALSRQIHDLEDELGFPLFERGAKSVRLTDAGKAFVLEARAVLQRAEQAIAAARAVASQHGSELHVGYAPSPTVRILPPTLRRFQARMPNVRVRLHDLSTEEMLLGIRERRLQLALLVKPNRASLRGLHFEEMARDTLCLAVPPGHPVGRAPRIELAEAAMLPLVIFSRKDYPEYLEYLHLMLGPGKHKLRIVEEHDSYTSLIAAIESGIGVAFVPQSFSCTAGPRLKLLPLCPAPAPLVIGALWSSQFLTPTAAAFIEVARETSSSLSPVKHR